MTSTDRFLVRALLQAGGASGTPVLNPSFSPKSAPNALVIGFVASGVILSLLVGLTAAFCLWRARGEPSEQARRGARSPQPPMQPCQQEKDHACCCSQRAQGSCRCRIRQRRAPATSGPQLVVVQPDHSMALAAFPTPRLSGSNTAASGGALSLEADCCSLGGGAVASATAGGAGGLGCYGQGGRSMHSSQPATWGSCCRGGAAAATASVVSPQTAEP